MMVMLMLRGWVGTEEGFVLAGLGAPHLPDGVEWRILFYAIPRPKYPRWGMMMFLALRFSSVLFSGKDALI